MKREYEAIGSAFGPGELQKLRAIITIRENSKSRRSF
jgi:hypothetical protein